MWRKRQQVGFHFSEAFLSSSLSFLGSFLTGYPATVRKIVNSKQEAAVSLVLSH